MPTGAESNLSSRPPCRGRPVYRRHEPAPASSGWPELPTRYGSSSGQAPCFLMLTPAGPGPAEAFKSAAGCRERSIVRFGPPPASCHCDRRSVASPRRAAAKSKPRCEVVGCCVANGHKHLYYSPLAPALLPRVLLGFRFENPARSMLDRAEGGSIPMDHGHGCHHGLILPDVMCARDLRLLHLQCSQYSRFLVNKNKSCCG
jgi:hypothetical protein